ncbi:phage tail protein [Staphylococcus aureus]|nr:phage tail protein [Staphylococcus aureus]MCQ1276636.1 phage tail protein [Staphylococcus aureus]WKD12510.1 phage tail protein [Staphylococcus aureus]HCX2524047.1 phage tail protein [Staphylococcus aureus]HCX2979748.1 phage tail protein [Staphylococcus aureus]
MAVKHASAPKAYINITGLGFAKLTKEGAELKYSDITKTRGLQKNGVETGGELKTAYADGGPIESGNTDGEGKISLQMHAFPKEIRKIVFNEDYDEDGVYEEKQGKQNNYVAVWFRQERRDGTFRTVLLPKVMFTNPKIDGETAEKDWDFSSEEVEGEALFPLVDNKKSVRKYIFDSANMTNHDGDGEKGEEAFLKKILGEEYTGNVTEGNEETL